MRALRIPAGRAASALLIAALAAGCDLFKPAEPEPPDGDVILGNYTTVDSTLDTMARAVRAKGQLDGQNAYLRGLADPALDVGRTFVAEFDAATLSGFQGSVPNPWGRNEESSFYSNFAGDDGLLAHDMEWGDGDRSDPVPTDSTATVIRSYRVLRLNATNSITTLATGYADMDFVRTPRGWVMVRWVDRENSTGPTRSSYGALRLNNQ